jgi:uncharacterized caspase-like protein
VALARPGKGKLWVVSAGVQQFDNMPAGLLAPLPFATNDARDLAAALVGQNGGQGKAYADVQSVVLTETSPDGKPTKANLLHGLQVLLEQAQPDDTILVFMSSHGITDAAEYYLVAKDSKLEDVNKVLGAQKGGTRLSEGDASSLLSGTELSQALRRLPGRRILMLDTCHSGAAGGAANPYALFKRSASAQIALVSAAKGDELSWQSPVDLDHSLFTIEMIKALRSTPENKGRGPVTLRAAFDVAAPRVKELLPRVRTMARDPTLQQTPVLSALPALESTVIAIH